MKNAARYFPVGPSDAAISSGVPFAIRFPPASAFRAKIHYVISRCKDVEVVLNDEHGASVVDQLVQQLEQLFDIVVMQTCSWLIKKIKGAAPEFLAQFSGKLDPLGLSPAQSRRRLSSLYIPVLLPGSP